MVSEEDGGNHHQANKKAPYSPRLPSNPDFPK